jgi:CheY-like chemotaxis protein
MAKRILLIEDEEGVRRLLRVALEAMGYSVAEAREGKEGLALFAKTPADLVLTDLVMPGKEGLETIRELRKSHPNLKIMAMSGGSRTKASDNLKMAKIFGADAVISKPFSVDQIARAVADLLGGHPTGEAEKVLDPE